MEVEILIGYPSKESEVAELENLNHRLVFSVLVVKESKTKFSFQVSPYLCLLAK
jgi:hypothetical protein